MLTAGVVALGLATWTPSKAQGPLYDRVNVTLPYTVTVGDRTLPPGDYTIQQLRDQGGGSRVLLIYSDNGMKFETSAMTIPALEGNNVTQEDTRVVLHHFGNDYYFDKVWIQGKNYGYEFPLPDAVKSRERERMQPTTVAAKYSTVQQTTDTAAATTTTDHANTATTAQTTASAATQPQTPTSAATAGQTTIGQHAAQNDTAAQSPTTSQSTLSAANQATTPQPATTQSPATMQPSTTQSQTTMRPSTTSGAATMSAATREATAGSADRAMPDTAAGWLMMLLGGTALSGAGLALRRRQ